MAFIDVFQNEFTTISMDPKGPLIRMVRSDVPFQSIEALERSIGDMVRTFDAVGRDRRVLLNDLRAISGRNDTAFEGHMKKFRPRLYGGFMRVGILVRSSVGALQIKRMVQEDGIARMVMTEESALIDYLLHG